MTSHTKSVVVTGAGSGIGQAISLKFAQAGYLVFSLDLQVESAKDTVGKIEKSGGHAHAIECDVSSGDNVQQAVTDILKIYPRIDVWVNNAGISHVGNLLQTNEEDLDKLYQVNVKGVYHGAQHAVKQMLKQSGGVLLNMASIASKLGIDDRFAYSMTKGAVHSMTLSIAKDFINNNIRCNAICPARIHTPFVDGFLARNYPGKEAEVFERLEKYQPIGRMGTPEEVANLAFFLCSDEAAFITGASYDLDGGVTQLR